MPWSLKKFLSSKEQHSNTDGGDKESEKKRKSSKSAKSSKKSKKGSRKSSNKGNQLNTANESYTEPLKESGESFENSSKIDSSFGRSSDDASSFMSGDLISNDRTKSDEEYKSAEDFPADCSNLTGYLETAILESASNTLERNLKTEHHEAPAPTSVQTDSAGISEPRMEEIPDIGDLNEIPNVTELHRQPSTSFDAGLYVEYINYDNLGADVDGGSSGEYFSSDDEADDNLNSNSNGKFDRDTPERKVIVANEADNELAQRPHISMNDEGIVARVEQLDGVSNNNTPYYDASQERKNNRTELNEKGEISRQTNRNGIPDANKKGASETIDIRPHERTASSAAKEEDHTGRNEDNHNCSEFRKEIFNVERNTRNADEPNLNYVGDIQDMEKAKSIFGMCLCQNGEQADHVTELDFRNCNLKQVPHEIFQYAHTLINLQLDSNTLSDLPKSLFSCENIEYLTVSDNDLGSLPPTLAGLANLKYLDISKNVIEDVPDCIKCCKSLSVLDASVNPIERLSDGFTQLVGLTELYLNDCFLEFLPANFGRLVQLTVLELRDNQLQILPKSIRRLSLLKRLDLGGNIFQEWPDVVCELRRLTELWLDGNELGSVPEQIGELTSLVYLDLSRNFIESIPTQIGSLRELMDLLLCENHITYLPDTLGFLDKLTMLKVSMNQLASVPESIGKLRDIEELDLSHNKLEEIPPTIGNLTMMHTLLLDNNALLSIPPEIGGCEKLNVLQLSRNKLEAIPREVGELSQLRVFNICRNRLPHLPITIIKLSQLEALWVSSNQSKPNVPLHAELGPDGKTRILTNILFPQLEQDNGKARIKTDKDGYANDAADDEEPPLFRRQRGVTRVAFNLEPVCHRDTGDFSEEEYDDDVGVDVPLISKDQNLDDKFLVHDPHHNSVDVSDDVMTHNSLRMQPLSLTVRSPVKSDSSMDATEPGPPINDQAIPLIADSSSSVNGADEYKDIPPPPYDDIDYHETPSLISDVTDSKAYSKEEFQGSVSDPKFLSVPDLSKTPVKGTQIEDTTKSSPAIDNQIDLEESSPRIKTWSSHSHLPAIPSTDSVENTPNDVIAQNRSSVSSAESLPKEVPPRNTDNVKVGKLPIPSQAIYDQVNPKTEPLKQIKVDDRQARNATSISDIPFMDGETSDESELAMASKLLISKPSKKVKPPPPPRKDSLNKSKLASAKPPVPTSKPAILNTSVLKKFAPQILNKPKSEIFNANEHSLPSVLNDKAVESSSDGLPPTDRDSGVGNDVDSQESIPDGADDEQNDVSADTVGNIARSVATFSTTDTRQDSEQKTSRAPPIAPKPANLPNKISANIKMFESISASPEHKAQPSSKTLANLLPSGPRKTEEKAIIRPNNHLNDQLEEKKVMDLRKFPVPDAKYEHISSVKTTDIRDIITAEPQPVMFLRNDNDVNDDVLAYNKALAEITTSPERRKVTRSRSDSSESTKQNQFRERLEKIMQQQKNVSAASKAAQNGAALSLSRKASFNSSSQPTSPDGSGLEKLTAENSFGMPDYLISPASPEHKNPAKKHSVSDRMKSKLDRTSNGPAAKTSSKISRSRPGSAPAAQLLQRRNSNQRNSISTPEGAYEDKRTLAPLYGQDENAKMDPRSRSKSIEQQLGQLLLDSDEERLNRNERLEYERRNDGPRSPPQLRLRKDSAGIRGSRNSLCSPPPVRHNMYSKARSSTNTAQAPLADWKFKLLQHVKRTQLERDQYEPYQNSKRMPRPQQPQKSIGKIKSPPRTSGHGVRQRSQDGSDFVPQPQNYSRRDPSQRSMGQKSVTAPALMSAPKMVTNTHLYKPEGQGVRSHFAGNSRAAKLAKQRTFTPGPENHGNSQMIIPRPKSAMEKFTPQHVHQQHVDPSYAEPPNYRQPIFYADLRSHKQQPLPTYEDYIHRRAIPYAQDGMNRMSRSESTRRSFKGVNNHGHSNYEDIAGYPLRQSGSHESLMDAARYNQQQDAYFPSTPLRNASSHDSVLDQPPYQPASYAPPYHSPRQQQRYPNNHIPQRYPVPDKRNKYNSSDYATYVNVYEYDQTPAEYHSQPQMQEQYQSRLGYRGSVRGQRQQQHQVRQDPTNYGNYAYPPNYHNTRQVPSYDQHYRQQREPLSPTAYRPQPEREEESVVSAFRPYHQVQQPPQRKSHHHNPYMHAQQYGLSPNQMMSPPNEYKSQRGMMSPPSNYQYIPEQPRHVARQQPASWSDGNEDFERVTVSVRRNPNFGFHVTGGIGAGGNSYRPMDDGVFITHVTPGGAADNKLQPGDKVLMVNGSDFVGISHQRAVDLLRNAGKVAVLVVERSLGKPV